MVMVSADNEICTCRDDNGQTTVSTTTDDDGRYTLVINDVANSSGDANLTVSTSGKDIQKVAVS